VERLVLEVLLKGLALGYVLVQTKWLGRPGESCIRETLVRFHTACPSAHVAPLQRVAFPFLQHPPQVIRTDLAVAGWIARIILAQQSSE